MIEKPSGLIKTFYWSEQRIRHWQPQYGFKFETVKPFKDITFMAYKWTKQKVGVSCVYNALKTFL